MSEGEEGGLFGFGGGGEEDGGGGGGFGGQDKKKKKDGGDKIIKHSTVLRVVFEEDTAPLFVTVQSFSWGVNGPYNSSSVGKVVSALPSLLFLLPSTLQLGGWSISSN